jgi:hypothetical protein
VIMEIWKEVPSIPGMIASSHGRVKLPTSTAPMPRGNIRTYETKPVTGSIRRANRNARHQYYGLFTSKYGNLKVHRLVCEAFHGPPPFDGAVVIHLNENALDNRPSNVKWGTQKENMNMPKFIAYCKSRTGNQNPYTKGLKLKAEF